jgi:hypothetical protein
MTDRTASFYERLVRKTDAPKSHALELVRGGEVFFAHCNCGWSSPKGTAEQVSAAWSVHVAAETKR